jgi:hypothetical protein
MPTPTPNDAPLTQPREIGISFYQNRVGTPNSPENVEMRTRSVAVGVVMFVVSAHAALAQAVAVSPGAPRCPEGQRPMIDSSVVTVVIGAGTAWNRRVFTDDDRKRTQFYADAIRQHFTPPASLGAAPTLAESQSTAWGGEYSRHSTVGGKLVLVVKPNGRLRDKFWQVQPLSAAFATAVMQATIAADTSRDFDGIPGAVSDRLDDTLVVQIRTIESDAQPNELPMMRAQLQSYIADTPAFVTKKGELYYPINAGDSGVENEGEMQVIVGSDGKAVMPSSQITRLDWRDFVSTMRRAIEGSTYQPAMSNGCAVPGVVIERFKFTMQGR